MMKKIILYVLLVVFILLFALVIWNGHSNYLVEASNVKESFSGGTLIDQRNENRFNKATLELDSLRNIVIIVSFILMIVFVFLIPTFFQGTRKRALIPNLIKKNIIVAIGTLFVVIVVIGFTYIKLYDLESIYSVGNMAYVIAYGRFIEYIAATILLLPAIVNILRNSLAIQKLKKINE